MWAADSGCRLLVGDSVDYVYLQYITLVHYNFPVCVFQRYQRGLLLLPVSCFSQSSYPLKLHGLDHVRLCAVDVPSC